MMKGRTSMAQSRLTADQSLFSRLKRLEDRFNTQEKEKNEAGTIANDELQAAIQSSLKSREALQNIELRVSTQEMAIQQLASTSDLSKVASNIYNLIDAVHSKKETVSVETVEALPHDSKSEVLKSALGNCADR